MQISSKKGNIRALIIVAVFVLLGTVSNLAIKHFNGANKGHATLTVAVNDATNIGMELSNALSNNTCPGSGHPTLKFSPIQNVMTSATFMNGINPCAGKLGDTFVTPGFRIQSTSIMGSLAPHGQPRRWNPKILSRRSQQGPSSYC